MAGGGHHELEELLEILALAELTVAGYYAACSRIGGVFGILCSSLKEQELQHASYLRTLQRWVKDHPEALRPGRVVTPQAVRKFIEHVRAGTERVGHRELTRMQMLAFALDIERSLLEHQPWEVVATDDPTISKMLGQLVQETREHLHKLQDQVARPNAARDPPPPRRVPTCPPGFFGGF